MLNIEGFNNLIAKWRASGDKFAARCANELIMELNREQVMAHRAAASALARRVEEQRESRELHTLRFRQRH